MILASIPLRSMPPGLLAPDFVQVELDQPKQGQRDHLDLKRAQDRFLRPRLGRPPGSSANHMRPREKVTLRIPGDLIAEYGDWSWGARRQLSELVGRALAAYGESRRR